MDIAELRRLEREATPGPWTVADEALNEHGAEVATIEAGLSVARPLDDSLIEPAEPEADAALIAAARNALPLLLDVAERAQELVAATEPVPLGRGMRMLPQQGSGGTELEALRSALASLTSSPLPRRKDRRP